MTLVGQVLGNQVLGTYLHGSAVLGGLRTTSDLDVLVTIVLQGDAALVGPSPAQLLDPVPQEDLIRGATAGIPQLLQESHPTPGTHFSSTGSRLMRFGRRTGNG